MKKVFWAVAVIVILAGGAYLMGYWSPHDLLAGRWRSDTPVSTPADSGTVRDRLDRLDDSAVRGVRKADTYVEEAGLSGKIKSKMALDDVVRARTISVSTTGGVVTLTGSVRTAAERDQAVKLARDTNGVTKVVDRLVIVP